MEMKRGSRNWFWILVQVALIAALLLAPRAPSLFSSSAAHYPGLFVQGAGLCLVVVSAFNLGKSLSPLPAPKNGGALKTDGLYQYVRHPMYTGVLLWAAGFALASGGLYPFVVFGVLCVFFSLKARKEETLLSQKNPSYKLYAQNTPRFIPSPLSLLGMDSRSKEKS